MLSVIYLQIIDEYLQSGIEFPKEATEWTHQDPDIERTVNYLKTHLFWNGQRTMEHLTPALLFSRLRTRDSSDIDFTPTRYNKSQLQLYFLA